MLAEKRETSPPIFVFRMTYFCSSWKRPSPCFQYVPTTMVGCAYWAAEPKYTHFKGGIDVLSVIPYSHTYFGRASLLVGDTAETWYRHLQQAQEFDSIYYIPYTGSTLVVYSCLYLLSTWYCTFVYNILLNTSLYFLLSTTVCCFHLNSGTSRSRYCYPKQEALAPVQHPSSPVERV